MMESDPVCPGLKESDSADKFTPWKKKKLSNGTKEEEKSKGDDGKHTGDEIIENGLDCNGTFGNKSDSPQIVQTDNNKKLYSSMETADKSSVKSVSEAEEKEGAQMNENGKLCSNQIEADSGKKSSSDVPEDDSEHKKALNCALDEVKEEKDPSDSRIDIVKSMKSDNRRDSAKKNGNCDNESDIHDVEHETTSLKKSNKIASDEGKIKMKDGDPESEGGKSKSQSPEEPKKGEKRTERSDSGNDDIEIIGESKVVRLNTPKNISAQSQNLVFVPAGLPNSVASLPLMSQGFTATNTTLMGNTSLPTSVLVQNLSTSSVSSQSSSSTASGTPSLSASFMYGPQQQKHQNLSLLTPSVAPPKPKSSLDQIELIRWEIQNRINTRPKYFKPNPSSELGPLAKFLFDIGSDLIKESVYHELVKIQSKKNDDDKLTDKEREDLEKLKEIEKDLYATIGHLKLKLKKRCKVCHFQTESNNVMFFHKQFPHEDNKILRCSHCPFYTKQAMPFKFHMEAEHNMQGKLHDKKAFFECDMCPYENNQEQKLILHKQRCIKQFRPLFNLHPSCLSGAEINLCLENIFYKPVVPKNLKLLQQKHAQQQAALAETRRQQAQMQALAAQKNAAAMAAKKLQQQQKRQPPPIAPRYNTPPTSRLPIPPKTPNQQPVRYNASANSKGPRPTVANMLNSKQNSATSQSQPQGSSAFEVCEICGGYVKDRKALRIHFFYAHRIDLPFNLFERNLAPLYCATCYVRFWTAQGLRKHIETHIEENQTRGVVGKCISCGHHVLNLLLHMRIVHNREMQHYVNALMCMFCGGHFNSRQECERHILKAHGNVDPLTGTLRPNTSTPPQPQQQQQHHKSSSSSKKSSSSSSNSLVKGSVCVLCNLNFGRNVDLTRHCMRMHHTCMKCGMVVIDKASLMKHTCLSSPSGTRDCSMCGETGFHPAYYVKHLRDKHLRKFSIRVSKLSRDSIERWTKRSYPFEESKDILVEISDSDDDLPLKKIKPASITPVKKRRMGPACKVGRRRESVERPEGVAEEIENIDDKGNGEQKFESDSAEDGMVETHGHEGNAESAEDLKWKSSEESPDAARSSKRKKSS